MLQPQKADRHTHTRPNRCLIDERRHRRATSLLDVSVREQVPKVMAPMVCHSEPIDTDLMARVVLQVAKLATERRLAHFGLPRALD